MNCIHITGRLVADPEIRSTASGISVCRLRVAVNRRFKDKQTGQYEADFISCTAWRGDADFISKWFKKGDWIEIGGELRNNNFTDNNGVKHYSMDVLVNQSGFVGNRSEGGQNAAQQPQTNQSGNYTPYQQATPQTQQQPPQQAPQSVPAQLGDLGDFEEILSDGDVPF